MDSLTFMLVAGEASGDLLGAELVRALKESPLVRDLPFPARFIGAGGPRMAEAGVELAFDLTRHSVIGISDVLAKIREFKRALDELARLAIEREPDVIVCIDFQGFNRRLAHRIRRRLRSRRGPFLNWNPKIVQFVSPQVWASRPGRAAQMERDLDLLLCLFPFEKDWYAARTPRLAVECVGHPLLDRLGEHALSACGGPQRANPGAAEPALAAPRIVLLPGSRPAELRRHLPVLTHAALAIRRAMPGARFRMVLPDDHFRSLAAPAGESVPELQLQTGGLPAALADADLAITKSGTVTLECACLGVPAVVIYKTSWMTYLAGRRIVRVPYLAMPNLLAGDPLYPEFIQHAATPDNVVRAALDLLQDVDRRARIRAGLARVVRSLGGPGACRRAARAVLSLAFS